MASFAELFKKYRLKSEFATLSEFGTALADKGFLYEDSIFSHWQNGTRIPNNRKLLLTLLQIFYEHKAINSLEEANNLLSAVGQGYVTRDENEHIFQKKETKNFPFQAPPKIDNFIGREEIIETLERQIAFQNDHIFLIHGPSGIGKTSLAIEICHKLKNLFPDGILWYKIENADPMDILFSIALAFKENINPIKDINTRSSVVRSLLANKKLLLVFDSVENTDNIDCLIPNSLSKVILTSKYTDLHLNAPYKKIPLPPFTNKDSLSLFEKIAPKIYTLKERKIILQIAEKVDYLPLPLHIFAKQMALKTKDPKDILQYIDTADFDSNLYMSIALTFRSFDQKTKTVFLSLGIFTGKDFSIYAIAAIHSLSITVAKDILQKLVDASLLQISARNRYRLHFFVKQYIRKNANIKVFIQKGAHYYADFLEKNKTPQTHFYNMNAIYAESENILNIYETCFALKLDKEIVEIWKNLGMFLWQAGEWVSVINYGNKVYSITKNSKDFYSHIIYTIEPLVRTLYLSGNFERSLELCTEALEIAKHQSDPFYIAFYEGRLGKIYQHSSNLEKSIDLTLYALNKLLKFDDLEAIAYTYKFLGEGYIYKKDYKKALDALDNSLKYFEKIQDMGLLIIIKSLLGGILYARKEFAEAKKYLIKTILMEKKYNFRIGISIFCNLTLALIAKKQYQINNASIYLRKAKKENEYLNLPKTIDETFALGALLKKDLQKAGYYIFE